MKLVTEFNGKRLRTIIWVSEVFVQSNGRAEITANLGPPGGVFSVRRDWRKDVIGLHDGEGGCVAMFRASRETIRKMDMLEGYRDLLNMPIAYTTSDDLVEAAKRIVACVHRWEERDLVSVGDTSSLLAMLEGVKEELELFDVRGE